METIATTSHIATLKNLGYIPAFLVGLGLDYESMFILAVLMVADTVLSVLRTMMLHGGNSFRSRILMHGVMSKILVATTPVIFIYAGKGAGINFEPLAMATISILIIAETYSILGHIQSIRTGEDVKEFDAVSMILKNVRGVLEKLLVASIKK